MIFKAVFELHLRAGLKILFFLTNNFLAGFAKPQLLCSLKNLYLVDQRHKQKSEMMCKVLKYYEWDII